MFTLRFQQTPPKVLSSVLLGLRRECGGTTMLTFFLFFNSGASLRPPTAGGRYLIGGLGGWKI